MAMETKRDKPVAVRLSKDEVDLAKKRADEMGLSVSAYIRMLILREEKK